MNNSNEQQQYQEKQEAEIREEMLFLLGSVVGRRFLNRIFAESGVWRTSYVPNDNGAMAFQEGQRNIGLLLFSRALAADAKTVCTNIIGDIG